MKGFRTIGLNVLIAALSGIAAYNWGDTIPEDLVWLGLLLTNGANIALRFFTNTSVGHSR